LSEDDKIGFSLLAGMTLAAPIIYSLMFYLKFDKKPHWSGPALIAIGFGLMFTAMWLAVYIQSRQSGS
jgi:Na+/phosphate symporter